MLEYHRKILKRCRDYEIVEITWPPGAKSRPHDHGDSFGSIIVVQGVIYQEVFEKTSKRFNFFSTYGAQKVVEETPDVIHVMGNYSREAPAVSIHTYVPRLKMTYYDRAIFLQACRRCCGTGRAFRELEGIESNCIYCLGHGEVKYYAPM